jgi:putative intracellular protease/amidase
MLKLRELERMASSIDHLTACCPLLLVVVLLLLHPEHSKPKSSPAAAVTSDVINDHHIQYIIFITLYLLPLLEIVGTHQIISKMAPKVLVVLTSQDKIPSNGHPTGWYLPELAHPWEVLHDKTELVIASPKGGEAPLDPSSVKMFENDPVASKFLNEQKSLWTNTVKLSDVLPKVSEFDAIFYVGGHGPMFDLVNDENSIALIEAFSAAKKPIAAVCHGPTVLLKAKAPSGVPLLSACTVTGFSNTEEDQVQMSSAMPFMLEDELQKVTGNRYVKADEPWGEKVAVSKAAGTGATVITGQNPASATAVGKEILRALGVA